MTLKIKHYPHQAGKKFFKIFYHIYYLLGTEKRKKTKGWNLYLEISRQVTDLSANDKLCLYKGSCPIKGHAHLETVNLYGFALLGTVSLLRVLPF